MDYFMAIADLMPKKIVSYLKVKHAKPSIPFTNADLTALVGGICSSDLQAAQTEHKDTRGAACTCSSSTSGQSLEFWFAGRGVCVSRWQVSY